MHFRIVAPSACVDIEKIQYAQSLLIALGHQVSLSEHIFAQSRYLAGTVQQRIMDLKTACLDPNIDAIWCARGGTGAAELVPYLQDWILNKVVIGYSDSTVLLNYIAQHGGRAIHGPVFQEISIQHQLNAQFPDDANKVIQLLTHNSSTKTDYSLTTVNAVAQPNHHQHLKVFGGNLTVLASLQGTSNALALCEPSLLMLEDVGEPYYRLERCLVQLLQSIDTRNLKAVVLGDFYQCPQKNVTQSIAEIFSEHLTPRTIPLYQCDWFGHGNLNHPFWIGKFATIAHAKLSL